MCHLTNFTNDFRNYLFIERYDSIKVDILKNNRLASAFFAGAIGAGIWYRSVYELHPPEITFYGYDALIDAL